MVSCCRVLRGGGGFARPRVGGGITVDPEILPIGSLQGKLFHRCIHDISPDDRGRASSGSGIHGLMHLLK